MHNSRPDVIPHSALPEHFRTLLDRPDDNSRPPAASTELPMIPESHAVFKAVASCLAQGMAPHTIADFIGCPEKQVGALVRDSRTLEELKNLTLSDGALNALENLLLGTQMDNVFTVLKIRDESDSERLRLEAAMKLMQLAQDVIAQKSGQANPNLPKDPQLRMKALEAKINRLTNK